MMLEKQTRKIFDKPVVLVGNHEPLIFRRRRGGLPAWETERFAYEHSEELVRKLAARGVNWIRTHFFKGYGLEAEREEIEMTCAFTELCHRHGIRVELYTQFGTLQYETFLAEEPTMLDWCALNDDGKHTSITYGHQDFRYKPCLTREGYWAYLQKALRVGIEEVKADGFGFDNVGHPAEPESCHCDDCRRAFREFLKTKYRVDTGEGRELAKERFGFSVLDHVEPPRFNRWNPMVMVRRLTDPVFQEWVEFKCDLLARRFEEIWRYVKARKSDMLIEYNVYGDFGCNTAYFSGIDMHRLMPWAEAIWNERAPHAPGYSKGGVFHHRVHPCKLAEAYDAVVFDWHDGKTAEQRRLAIAESLAFNRGNLSGYGSTVGFAAGSWSEFDEFRAFRAERNDLFRDAKPAARVALVEASRSLNYECIETHYAQVLAMGSLLAGHVPFDLLGDPGPEAMSAYGVLVIPEARYLKDEEAQSVMDFVKAGGSVVVTGETSLYDAWGRRRQQAALYPMMKTVKAFAPFDWKTGERPPRRPDGKPVRGEFGGGRWVWLPRLEPVKEFEDMPAQWEIHPHYWHLPKNLKAFLDAISWAGEGKLDVEVTAPLGLACESRVTPDGRRIVHLVNYSLDRSAQKVSLKLSIPNVKSARLWEVGKSRPRRLALRRTRAGIVVNVGTVKRYAVVEIA